MSGAVALVSAKAVRDDPEHDDPDGVPLLDALHGIGVSANIECWDDARVDWAGYRLAVLRSTWDYVTRREEFLAWIDLTAADVTVCNPPSVVRPNTDKHYFEVLMAKKLPVVPTQIFEPGAAPAITGYDVGDELVVKPAVGAGARDVGRFSTRVDAESHLDALLKEGRAALVQPYLRDVDTHGETGMVYYEGRFSHAFRKGPMLEVGAKPSEAVYAPEAIEAHQPTDAERRVADAVVAATAADLLYARVDLLRGADGSPLVTELELTEPSFFFAWTGQSPEGFAQAIARRLATLAS